MIILCESLLHCYELNILLLQQMKKEFEGWEPLKRPRHGLSAMERWKIVLEGIDQPYRVAQSTHEFLLQPYDRLMWEVVMPYIRTTLRYVISGCVWTAASA